MDNTTENQESDFETEQALIDVFYKDDYRLNSLISQINNGALQSVMTTRDSSQGAIATTHGEIGIPKILNIGATRNSSETEKRSIRETKKPYDEALLRLLEQLAISPQTAYSEEIYSALRIIRGRISLKNYKLFSELIPVFDKGDVVFDSEEGRERKTLELKVRYLKQKTPKSKAEKETLKLLEHDLLQKKLKNADKEALYQDLPVILPFFPKGIGLEIVLSDKTILKGNLKSEYLIDPPESIFLTFGEVLPGEWNILGIIDPLSDSKDSDTNMRDFLPALNDIVKMFAGWFYTAPSQATIIPLLIYRELSIQ